MDHAGHAFEGLKEIPLPPPVSYTPQTAGWVIVGALMIAAIGYVLRHVWTRHKANRYRRVAASRLDQIESQLTDPAMRLEALAAIPVLVKRTALSAMPREKVAGLSATAWLECLDRTYAPGGFSTGPGKWLTTFAYAGSAERAAVPDSEIRALLTLIRRWIEQHDVRV
ncbi:hypothetical protein W02_17640 [Nitrospira sp. KM1]|nr:hypothetical protein W02_17640 [Nitrospira sp. KM1]